MERFVDVAHLEAIDREATSFERPVDFERVDVAARFGTLVAGLATTFACDVEVDAHPKVQDASFFGHVAVPATSTASGERLWVRVSNFGHLAVSGLSNPGVYRSVELDVRLDARDRERVAAAIAAADLTPVLEDTLALRYHGRFAPAVKTWFGRFFDYG